MLKPLNGYIVIEQEDAVSKTKGGLFIPDSAQGKRSVGFIRALPDEGCLDIKLNDKILYLPFAGKTIKYEDKEYILINYDSIEAILEN